MKFLIALALVPTFGAAALAANTPKQTGQTQSTVSKDTYSDSSRALEDAEKQGQATTKTGGSTMVIPDNGTENGGTGVPVQRDPNSTADRELRSTNTTTTGGTGTSMDDAGAGSKSNTTGTGR